MSVSFDLSDQVVVITGGGGILGRRFSHALVAQGANTAIIDRNFELADKLAKELNAVRQGSASAYKGDISDPKNIAELRKLIERDLGPATALINNAATKTDGFFEPFESFSLSDWEEVMKVNVTGVMLCCQEFGADMARRGRGSIINILSIYGIVAPDQRIYEGSFYEGHPINTPAVYSTSKAAIFGLTKYLATYWGDKGVRVNAITPGGVFSGQNDTFVSKYSSRVPMGRMADGDEIAAAAVFLVSSASSYVTGQNIVVDGGLTAW